MTPLLLLSVGLALTLIAVMAQVLLRERQMRRLARLAAEARMNYSATDHLRLGERIAERFPLPGASGLRAFDLIYGRAGRDHRFIFTVDCTLHHGGYDRRVRRVCWLVEPAEGSPTAPPPASIHLSLAPDDLPIAEQYRYLIEQIE